MAGPEQVGRPKAVRDPELNKADLTTKSGDIRHGDGLPSWRPKLSAVVLVHHLSIGYSRDRLHCLLELHQLTPGIVVARHTGIQG